MFNFLGQNKSMWGTPGMPMWGGGNNINTQGMWAFRGFPTLICFGREN
jgi:hypothetical protein